MWVNTKNLKERKASLSAWYSLFFYSSSRARARLANWKKISAFADDPRLIQRMLASVEISQADLLRILGTPAKRLKPKQSKERWVAMLEKMLLAFEPKGLPEALEHFSERGLIAPLIPLILFQYERLLEGFNSLETDQNIEQLGNVFLWPYLQSLEYNSRRAVILELNISRVKRELGEHDEAAQFKVFKERFINTNECESFLIKYPILAKYAVITAERWTDNSVSVVERYLKDKHELRTLFEIDESEEIVAVDFSGDTHNFGQAVIVFSLSGGSKIVYKPRPVQLEAKFYNLLSWFNELYPTFGFKVLKVIDKGSYGWVEYCEYRPLSDNESVDEFHYRLGALSAIIYALNGVDIFFENLIAHGDQPVVIDLETILHTDLELKEEEGVSAAFDYFLRDSILSQGIYPRPTVSASGDSIFCVSVLGARVDQKAPYFVTELQNFGRSDMFLAEVPGWIPETQSNTGAAVSSSSIHHQIERGFSDAYRKIESLKPQFIEPGGILDQFHDLEARVIVRDTVYYGGLDLDAFHPDLLRDGLDRDWHYDQLWNEVSKRPYLGNFISSEKSQIDAFDIPYFSVNIGSNVIKDSSSNVYECDFKLTGIQQSRSRIGKFNETDLEKQLYLISLSLGTCNQFINDRLHFDSKNPLRNAELIGSYIQSLIISCGEVSTFAVVNDLLPTNHDESFKYSINEADNSLYDGVAGCSLFFAYLHESTGRKDFKELSLALARKAFMATPTHTSVSAFVGVGGNIYLSAMLYPIFGEEWLIKEGLDAVEKSLTLIEADREYDILLGCSGTVLTLIALKHVCDSTKIQDAIDVCANHLSNQIENNSLYDSLNFKRGFSHGLSGIAYVCGEIYRETNQSIFATYTKKLLEMEDQLIEGSRWTDEHMHEGQHQISWCHGAAGILLAREKLRKKNNIKSNSSVLDASFPITKNYVWKESHCLCHGSIGNIEILRDLYNDGSDFLSLADIEKLSSEVSALISERGWASISADQSMNIGLMTGLAGLGYFYLRCAKNNEIPSIFTLENNDRR